MKERAFIDAVHRQLPSWIHRQSMTLGSMTHAGTPDYYYDLSPLLSPSTTKATAKSFEKYADSNSNEHNTLRSTLLTPEAWPLTTCSSRDMWIEYKSMSKECTDFKSLPSISPVSCIPTDLQQLWLNRRYYNGGNVLVIVGVKIKGRAHGFILRSPEEWSVQHSRESYSAKLLTAAEIAAALISRLQSMS